MNRIEELSLKLIDGDISDAEFAELERLLADDPQALSCHASLLDLEAALLARLNRFDVAPQTMATIRELVPRPEPEPEPEPVRVVERRKPERRPSARRFVRMALAASLLALIGVGVLYYQQLGSTPVDARVAQADDGIVIERDEQSLPARAGWKLAAGDRLVVPAGAAASVEYADSTRLIFGPQSATTFQTGRGPTKRLVLQTGALVAHVPKQAEGAALEASTPHAQARVLGTRFLLAAAPAETRLDVIEGRVRLTRSGDRAAVLVSRGQFAVAAPGAPQVAQPLPRRITESLVVLYRFDEGRGTTVRDQSGFEPTLDLEAESDEGVDWLPSGGLQVTGGAMLSSPQAAEKIVEACQASDELTIEAWVTPARAEQSGPARIVTLSNNTDHRNFALGQGSRLETPTANHARFVARLRTTEKDRNGEPAIYSPDQTAVPDLTHVVFTRSRDGTERLYVDSILRSQDVRGGDFSNWDGTFRLALGNEFTRNRTWEGVYHLVAIHSRSLTETEVLRNFRAGVADPARTADSLVLFQQQGSVTRESPRWASWSDPGKRSKRLPCVIERSVRQSASSVFCSPWLAWGRRRRLRSTRTANLSRRGQASRSAGAPSAPGWAEQTLLSRSTHTIPGSCWQVRTWARCSARPTVGRPGRLWAAPRKTPDTAAPGTRSLTRSGQKSPGRPASTASASRRMQASPGNA
jgi:ferric-dicitrate binding protein FerR (iron transport regulator)